ncbi:PREDICTED: probable LRR receptor-like serine/threonine-protein kinase At1g67720 isoform X1 [Nelumbo nucifera]|uniref:Probable LRR receptor-like serine/threonine-protein kinase At1g67720 isoform X1 n=1 Tax=Nelumbo nucifera TaxID=4432 RepID=A0A1U8Q115_NELNU|nr:PREDICTED: probable LRR receptor-like serine/threonine-protein kinase At1g67720 isoform X1 [Nelumbo nucifera]XP_019052519.1 PREDICTED: probable LRR receptor-like serine/threonine-protein kinase At1g67720 isoform X1 [Nelumbo nucifera]
MEWVICSSGTPPRITKLWLDGNSFTGPIPDLSNLVNFTIVHLENNGLTGTLPSYLADLPSINELYVQNNSLSGEIPPTFLTGKIVFKYDSNSQLVQRGHHNRNSKLIIWASIGAVSVFAVLLLGSLLLLCNAPGKSYQEKSNNRCNSAHVISKRSSSYSLFHGGSLMDEALDMAYYITLSDIEEATQNFSKKIGKGSFGPVYYGKMKDGKEVEVKILADASSHGNHQFVNEVLNVLLILNGQLLKILLM